MSTEQGILAEKLFEIECLKRGFRIYSPICDNHGIDYSIKLTKNKSLSIQVKSTSSVDLRNPSKPSYKIGTKKGFDSRRYNEKDFDFLAAYIFDINTWYIIPISEIKTTTIRLNPKSENCKFYKYINAFYLLGTGSHP